MRTISKKYFDPLDQLWINTAEKIGFSIKRSDDAFATYDGEDTLYLATSKELDQDDSLAQMILHEICHSLIEGATSFRMRDWGLENESYENAEREHACLRLQAFLLGRHGLRQVFAPTTDHRSFYDALEENPLENINDKSVRLAKLGVQSSTKTPWNPHLDLALKTTETMIRLTLDVAGDLNHSLFDLLEDAPPPHDTKLLGRLSHTCEECVWFENDECKQSKETTQSHSQACERFESDIDCQNCGACCGKAYHSVTVDQSESAISKYPELFVKRSDYIELKRKNGSCIALGGSIDKKQSHACNIYKDRPSCCREFTLGSPNCLEARRRVGLSL